MEEFNGIYHGVKVIQEPDIADVDDFDARRPYFRIRGPRVTEQQAFEIIRKTDSYITCRRDSEKYRKLVLHPNRNQRIEG